jgi:hypothetical protein
MRRFPAWISTGLVVLGLLSLAGCQRQRPLAVSERHPLRVRVTRGGQPVRFVIVNLDPVDPKIGGEADGCTDENGTFEPRTLANDGSRDGLIPARYKVVLEEYDPVRLVAIRPLPPGARPTSLPSPEWDTGVVVEFGPGEAELKIDLP